MNPLRMKVTMEDIPLWMKVTALCPRTDHHPAYQLSRPWIYVVDNQEHIVLVRARVADMRCCQGELVVIDALYERPSSFINMSI
jgi:hypothetical protein